MIWSLILCEILRVSQPVIWELVFEVARCIERQIKNNLSIQMKVDLEKRKSTCNLKALINKYVLWAMYPHGIIFKEYLQVAFSSRTTTFDYPNKRVLLFRVTQML